jgi:23S rRNA (adenine2503-C2)-methyltransferase
VAEPSPADGLSEPNARDLRDLTLGELERVVTEAGEQPYRARQVMRRLWIHGAESPDAMPELPGELRRYLKQRFRMGELRTSHVQKALDGTRKLLLRLADGVEIETVIIPMEGRTTLCISGQAGCAMGCQFCATARMGLRRNLAASEILGQILAARSALVGAQPRSCHPERSAPGATKWSGADDRTSCQSEVTSLGTERLTNYVFMGMGEPLANYPRLARALTIMTAEWGLAISPRRITVSTVGLVPMMEQLLTDFPVNLAVSLHATTDQLRDQLVPINRRYPLAQLLDACRRLPLNRRNRITFEYVMLSGVNDSLHDAHRLLKMLAPIRSKVNLIFFNSFPGAHFEPTPRARVQDFQAILLRGNLTATIRESRGRDIAAACGQLYAERGMRREE